MNMSFVITEPSTMLLLIGAICIIIPLLNIVVYKINSTWTIIQKPGYEKYFFLFGAILLFAGFGLAIYGSGSATTQPPVTIINNLTQTVAGQTSNTPLTPTPTPTPQIHITYPLNGATINSSEIATGTVENLPAGNTVILFAYPQVDDKYYPEMNNDSIIHIDENGNWHETIYVGLPNNSGDYFNIVATVADQKAQDDVKNYFTTAEKTNKWGMSHLPASIKVYDTIRVTRV